MNDSENNYQVKLHANTTLRRTFEALTTNIHDWWGQQDKPVTCLGDIFKVSWGEPWYEFEVIEYKPDQKITWKCVDANQRINGLEGVEKEWVGTKLYWIITELGEGNIELQLIHEGLIPDFTCYEFCSKTWDSFVNGTLKAYLEG